MAQSQKEDLIVQLKEFEETCNDFLETLQSLSILNFNLDSPQKVSINVQSDKWKIFYNDMLSMLTNYKGDLDYNFERFILNFNKAVRLPNPQNITDLKVAIHSLRTHLEYTSYNDIEKDFSTNDDNIWTYIHPLISSVSRQRFMDNYYADAVESAFKEINSRVKRLYQIKTNTEKDGVDLMRKAFSPNNPVLIFESLNTQNGQNVQAGYMEIFAGAMQGIRNPKAHSNVVLSKEQAVQRLMLASLLMSKIDESVAFTGICE